MSSWDRFEIPLPFSRAIFLYGDPIEVPSEISSQQREEFRLELESSLNALSREAENNFEFLYAQGSE